MKNQKIAQILDPKYQSFSEEILQIIEKFDQNSNILADGDRNMIKIASLSNGEKVTIKAFKIPNLINQFVYKYFRKSKAKRSYQFGKRLLQYGFLTPQPIFYREEFSSFRLGKSFYISALYPTEIDFRKLLLDVNYPNRKEILTAFTEFTFQLHEKGILFIDHSPGNTLVKKENDRYTFALIDLNRMRFQSKLNYKERIANFAKLSTNIDDIHLIANRYAELYHQPKDQFFYRIWLATLKFQKKFYGKKLLKLRLKKQS